MVLRVFAAALACMSWPGIATAQVSTFPAKAITYVVPFPPSGSTDRVTRLIAQRVSEATGQPHIIDNKPGGGGLIGAVAVKQAAPDGHTLFAGHAATHAINVSLYSKLPYDPVRDFRPITTTFSFPSVIVVPAALPVQNMRELVALAKAKPGGLSYSSQGIGTGGHLQGAMLEAVVGVPLVHVPMKGAAAAATELVAGRVDLLFSSYITAGPFIRDGRLRMIAMASEKRSPALPDLSTTREQGVPGVELDYWFGLLAPAGTPDPVVRRLNELLTAAIRHPEVHQYITSQAADPIPSTPEAFADLIARDTRVLGEVVKRSGARAD